jgi:L-amino acid N-acyltransferase YncA
MEVVFRDIEEKDVPQIMEFFTQLREEDAGVSFTECDREEQIREWIGNPDVFVYVAEYENRVVGVFKARREGSHKKHSAFLTAAVDKDFRGHNVAKNLTNYGLSRLPQRGIGIARAYIFSDNKPSINTILSCGFQFSGSVYMHHYDEKNQKYVDDLIFHKIL